MAKTVTTRLDDEYVNKINEMAAKKGIDRTSGVLFAALSKVPPPKKLTPAY
jgi:hypothetical protein